MNLDHAIRHQDEVKYCRFPIGCIPNNVLGTHTLRHREHINTGIVESRFRQLLKLAGTRRGTIWRLDTKISRDPYGNGAPGGYKNYPGPERDPHGCHVAFAYETQVGPAREPCAARIK